MKHVVVAILVIGLAAVFLPLARSGGKSRARGEYFCVVVDGVVSHSLKKVGMRNYYKDARGVNNALEQLDREGYEPVSITGVGDNSVAILLREK